MDVINLSGATQALWAKTGTEEEAHLWEPLYIHMLDSAAVGAILWTDWLADSVRTYVEDQTSLETEQLKALVSFMVGIHDIGKATPNFQCKVADRAELVRQVGLPIPSDIAESYSHAYMGQVLIHGMLEGRGWNKSVCSACSDVVGGHHGAYPSEELLHPIENTIRPKHCLGDGPWKDSQSELLELVLAYTRIASIEPDLTEVEIATPVRVLITGLTIMADWITSNTDYFPLVPRVQTFEEITRRADEGWSHLRLPCAEHFASTTWDPNVLFKQRFSSLPSTAQLRPVQEAAVEAAQSAQEASLLIIEAPMGCGKTEASLLCAEVFASRFTEGGLAYLLPTQATSNAMYGRVEAWLESVHADNDSNTTQDIHLLHGKAALNPDWQARASWPTTWMGSGDDPGDPADAIIAHQWFSGRKRGLLAPFVVGTVDQLLFMALKAKHVQLRHLGLAEKVVVIDEVHAYDAYMSVYLDRALAFLGRYHVPVVLLSATLPPERRNKLIQAYRGQDFSHKSRRQKRVVLPEAPRLASGAPAYPLITCASSHEDQDPIYQPCPLDNRETVFEAEFIPDDDESLIHTLRTALAEGGCICVLRNTVRRAQETYELLRQELDVQVELVHSRFIARDRAKNDEKLLKLLGPDSLCRPEALVVVGTQVIEQSLDIDFDMIITDIAPIDLLLQRMGRVHRHKRGDGETKRPPALRQARCVITGIESWEDGVPQFERGTTFVYQPLLLLRSVLALQQEKGAVRKISLPQDIAPLVERVYDIDGSRLAIPDSWQEEHKNALEQFKSDRCKKEKGAKDWLLGKFPRYGLTGWMNYKTNLDDEIKGAAKVRDSQESIEVVVICKDKQGFSLLPWVAEEENVGKEENNLGNGHEAPPEKIAHAAALCTVSLPPAISWDSDKVIAHLEQSQHDLRQSWEQSRWLKGLLPLILDTSGNAEIPAEGKTFRLHYSRTEGLCYFKKEDE